MIFKGLNDARIVIGLFLFFSPLTLLFQENSGNRLTANNNQTNSETEIIFISDTQDLISVERLWNITNNNEEVREKLYADILNRSPKAVFHFGDLVSLGYWESTWNHIDTFVNKLSKEDIPFYPVMGNHELMIFPKTGEEKFQSRYPDHSKTGYLIKIDSIAVIMLNSNFGILSTEEIDEQNYWYNNILDSLDDDPSINMVIVGTHYPPYTNSTRVNPSTEVQEHFVPGYLNSQKAKIFFSGHCHAFEHINIQGKDFLVIGGGGGPQQELLVDDEVRWKDHFSDTESVRRFHYVSMKKNNSEYIFDVIMVDSTYSYLEKSYEFVITN